MLHLRAVAAFSTETGNFDEFPYVIQASCEHLVKSLLFTV